jgi:dTMP kinase
MTKTTTEAAKAADAASQAQVAADDAQKKANDAAANRTPEQKKADEALQKADDARAEAAEAAAKDDAAKAVPTTATEAGVLAIVPAGTMAGDHVAQKFGNDPANPKPAPGVDMTANLVKLVIQKPEPEGKIYCEVPEKMVGDYERAGWNRA